MHGKTCLIGLHSQTSITGEALKADQKIQQNVNLAVPCRAKAGLSQSNVLQLQTDGPGKSISMRGFSSRATGSAASAPYEIGKSAVSTFICKMKENLDDTHDLLFLFAKEYSLFTYIVKYWSLLACSCQNCSCICELIFLHLLTRHVMAQQHPQMCSRS